MNNFKTLCNYNQKSLSEKKILFLTLVCTIPTNVFDIYTVSLKFDTFSKKEEF